MEEHSKKELKERYKNRSVIGGIYCIKCNGNDHLWMKSTVDMVGQKNKFEFFVSANICPETSMLLEWNRYGAKLFSFIVLEKIEKRPTQTEREFKDDIDVLLELWMEKQHEENLK